MQTAVAQAGTIEGKLDGEEGQETFVPHQNPAGTSALAIDRSDVYQLPEQPLTREIDSILGCFGTADDFERTEAEV